jgi:hypothetical protein
MEEGETTVLYRPVGSKELELFRQSGNRSFPPRLPGQGIFYPVLTEEYAVKIARDWNVKQTEDERGYVTRFRVRTSYLRSFEPQLAGGQAHQEYWIPADSLDRFNASIVSLIEVVAEFRSGPRVGS